MKKRIRRIKPPKEIPQWNVSFHTTPSGISIDISHFQQLEGEICYHLARTSYLISMEQIRLWAKGKNAPKR